jgi:hypothetical protein
VVLEVSSGSIVLKRSGLKAWFSNRFLVNAPVTPRAKAFKTDAGDKADDRDAWSDADATSSKSGSHNASRSHVPLKEIPVIPPDPLA